MPNLDTHAGIALRAFPERGVEFAAGEVFDDAVRMAGGKPRTDVIPSLFQQGIRSNNSVTDPAFDHQPALVAAQAGMKEDLVAAGIPRRLHGSCIGPGTDILFSGVSMQDAFAAEAYLEVCDFLLSSAGVELTHTHADQSKHSGFSRQEITGHVAAIARHGLRAEYSDPAFVVGRLRARVASRRLPYLFRLCRQSWCKSPVFSTVSISPTTRWLFWIGSVCTTPTVLSLLNQAVVRVMLPRLRFFGN